MHSGVETVELQTIEDENSSTQKGLDICDQFLTFIDQARPGLLGNVGHSSRSFGQTPLAVAPNISRLISAEGLNSAQREITSWKVRLLQQQCLRISEDAQSYIASLPSQESSLLRDGPDRDAKGNGQDCSEPELLLRQDLDEYRDKLQVIVSQLQNRLKSLLFKNDPNDAIERSRLLADINSSKRCLEVCKAADESFSRKKHRFGEGIVDNDSSQMTTSETLAELLEKRFPEFYPLIILSKTSLSELPQSPVFEDQFGPGSKLSTLIETTYNVDSPRAKQGLSHPVLIDSVPGELCKDPVNDSGYASASVSAEMMVSSDSVSREIIHSPGAYEPVISRQKNEYDVQSYSSEDDEIGSQRSFQTTREEMTGKALIRLFLAEEPRFRSLCEKALEQMDQARFVRNLRRLLKSFHKNVSAEAEVSSEKAVANLLRSRRGRLRISQDLHLHILEDEQPEDRIHIKPDLQVPSRDQNLVERWLTQAVETPINFQELEAPEVDIESLPSDIDGPAVEQFPNIAELKSFLKEARSFQILLKDFTLMFLPDELKHVLLSIPRKQVWVSRDQDLSLINRAKLWVEHKSRVKWNWWPLEQGKRLLKENESRVFWECVSPVFCPL